MKRVLFVCIQNSCRSQMAEGFARELGKGVVEVYSAGSRPSGKVDPDAVKVMAEAGIDISGNRSKGFQEIPFNGFDWVITMGCGDRCPFVPAEQRLDWAVEDPKGKSLDFFREVRDQIKKNVEKLVQHIAFNNRRNK